eukprot:GFUD01004519.1.p1 GENE.GFUD01004519.1~~GFUD01004519.1.p1  ORF type:complete len:239 (+),score=79.38 GFUD01004519.1:187-903(+)
MEESKANDCEEKTVSENAGQYLGKDNFRMYYALGPEVEHGNSIEYGESEEENFSHRKFKYFTSDFEEDTEDNEIDLSKEYQGTDLSDDTGVKDGELSDDSGTAEYKEWNGSSVPPDIVASVNHLKVIREEPRKNLSKLGGDLRKNKDLFKTKCDQDITDFRRHQVEAYTNLEDLLDEPWEESDFAPPSKVDVVLRVGGDLGERYSNVVGLQGRRKMRVIQKAGLDPAQCGPLCNCSVM